MPRLPSCSPLLVCLMVLGAAAGSGCATLGRPQWLDPPPTRVQQRRAVRFDPFPQNDIDASPLRTYGILDGTRPRDYIEPAPEIRRSRWWSQPLP